MNLAVNAQDAMPEGGRLIFETRNLRLDAAEARLHGGVAPGEYVALTVTDSGHGIERVEMRHLFEPFYTTKPFGKGTGLGLSVVYGIVRNHDGHVACYSERGVGTTFRIYLPALEETAEQAEDREEETVFGGMGQTILVVDDETAVRRICERLLGRIGYDVIVASNGEEAIRLYGKKKEQIDLVILDLVMPGMGGLKCLETLAAMDPDVKVLISTGYSLSRIEQDTGASGAIGFLSKPYNLLEVSQTVQKALAGAAREG
jgi:CheY-like chemotaxis protein